MGKIFWIIVAIAVIAIIIGAVGLASSRAGQEGIGTNVKFTSSPAQVRFFDGARSGAEGGWSEWWDLPFPSGDFCQTGDVADTAEVRLHPGLSGIWFAVRPLDGSLKVAMNGESVISVEGVGKAIVKVIGQGDDYACELVLTKK